MDPKTKLLAARRLGALFGDGDFPDSADAVFLEAHKLPEETTANMDGVRAILERLAEYHEKPPADDAEACAHFRGFRDRKEREAPEAARAEATEFGKGFRTEANRRKQLRAEARS